MSFAVSSPYDSLAIRLAQVLTPGRVITDPLRRLAWGSDASSFQIVPQLVVVVEDEAEVCAVLDLCRRFLVPVTFRAAGTSLSGQALGTGVLVQLGDGWGGIEIMGDGRLVRLKPGVVGAGANRRLAPFGRKIGPDPASIDAARIGGIAANNASGMCCGVAENSYQTLHAMRIILADGSVVDTADQASRQAFQASHAAFLERLTGLARRTRADEVLAGRIRRKFRIKNTVGYSLNALIDFDDPFDILAHLMIGSEGTLGFIAEITYRTVPDHPFRASGLALFSDMTAACRAVMALAQQPVAAVELLDRASLASVADKPGLPPILKTLSGDATALLIEVRGATAEGRDDNLAKVAAVLAAHGPLEPPAMTSERAEIDRQWAVRRGMFPTVGALRRTGTTIVTEDVAVPMEHLAQAALDLRAAMERHGYSDAIIFGHALAGNLHFLFPQDFGDPAEVDRYGRFMEDIADVIADRYQGSLKAEHGTGRAMAPFVEQEWGRQAYDLMGEIKRLFDPFGLLNPGVILNDDAQAHVRNLKPSPAAFPAIDKCIECGMCEGQCPSHGLTLSPRQRIVGWREIARRQAAGQAIGDWGRLFDDFGVDTCATCGLCSQVCPVGIDTGVLTKTLRGRRRGRIGRWLAAKTAERFAVTTRLAKGALAAARLTRRLFGPQRVERASRGLRRLVGTTVPLLTPTLPNPATGALPVGHGLAPRMVYVPSCANRTLGPSEQGRDQRPLPEVVASLCAKAGVGMVVPAGIADLCCGLVFESKGMADVADRKGRQMAEAILAASDGGRLAVVMDASPCSLRLRGLLEDRVAVLDLPAFLLDVLLPRLAVTSQDRPVFVHQPCSLRRLGAADKLVTLAQALSPAVMVADDIACCGFAGDKGLFRPDLNAHALRRLAGRVPADAIGCSSSRTCEIGLERHVGISVQSIAYLLDQCSEALQPVDSAGARYCQ